MYVHSKYIVGACSKVVRLGYAHIHTIRSERKHGMGLIRTVQPKRAQEREEVQVNQLYYSITLLQY